MLEVRDLTFSYRIAAEEISVLKCLDFRVRTGEFVAIQGPSGSGKSTLFYILGFLLKPTRGKILFDGIDATALSQDELTVLRNRRIGFVFQQFHLLSKTDVVENILLPTHYPSELADKQDGLRQKAVTLATDLGLGAHLKHFPNQLSGGQQQRVAIARALIQDVDLILADEPTGNLDSRTAGQILDLLRELNRQGKTIILITHDAEVAKRCSKVYHLRDGAFTQIEENYPPPVRPEDGSHARDGIPKLPSAASPALYRRIARSVLPLVTENLLRNKAKSILTMLGVVIGVAAVLAMVTLGQFTKRRILESYEAMGVNKLLLRGYPNWNLKATDALSVSFRSFDWQRDFAALPKLFPELRYMSPVLTNWQNKATAGGLMIEDKVSFFGVTPEYLAITNRTLEAGRNLSPYHVEKRAPVCVVGLDIAKRLFPRTNAIGQVLTLTDGRSLSFPCLIIGVLATMTSNKDWSPPNLHVLLPYTYFQTVNSSWHAQIHEAAIQVDALSDVELAGKKIKSYFEQKYGKAGQFFIDSDSTLVAQMKRFLNLFAVLLAAIALLSLVVGGIGINNMMLVSVTERIKEFGLRKALGATHRSIRTQVLMESLGLCITAGILGILIGFGAYELMIYGATKFVPNLRFEWVFEPVAAALSLVSIIAVGVASGLVPALRAEKLQVIEALRSE